MAYGNFSNINAFKMDTEIDFNKLVVLQMDRCNTKLSEGSYAFITSVMSFSCMLAHLKQRDDRFKKEEQELEVEKEKMIKENKLSVEDIDFKLAVTEYEMLVRLCARNDLFPRKRGELLDDEDDE